jgi:siderophore synthetase component
MNPATNISLKSFLNCYLLGKDNYSLIKHQGNDYLEINFPRVGVILWVKLNYYSITGRHQLSFPVYQVSSDTIKSIDFWQVLDFILEELKLKDDLKVEKIVKFRGQLENSLHNQAVTLENITDVRGLSSLVVDFALSESSLLSGHQLHPSAKSCYGFSQSEYLKYYPEFANLFQLHYFLVSQDVIHSDSKININLTKLIADDLVAQKIPEGKSLLPLHPWQANYLLSLESVQQMIANGELINLGALGKKFQATSSIRTLYSREFEYMFKMSLNVMITNSVRMNQARELDRAIAVTEFWQTPIASEFSQSYPFFRAIKDPGYLCLKYDGQLIEESAVLIRDNPFYSKQLNVSCIAALCQDNPFKEGNRFNTIIPKLAAQLNLSESATAEIWFKQFIEAAIEPLLWLFSYKEIALEAHQQNLLIELDANGLPIGGYYRDSQGYYISEKKKLEFDSFLHIFSHFASGDSEFVAHHFTYYLICNSLMAVINALGYAGYIDEEVLITIFTEFLLEKQQEWGKRTNKYLEYLLSSQTLPMKDNLATRLQDLDELTAPLSQQSVYLEIKNPFYSATRDVQNNSWQEYKSFVRASDLQAQPSTR